MSLGKVLRDTHPLLLAQGLAQEYDCTATYDIELTRVGSLQMCYWIAAVRPNPLSGPSMQEDPWFDVFVVVLQSEHNKV